MWKWCVILGLFLICLIPLPVLAYIPPSSADIVITATGIVVAAPGGFTVTYVSDSEIGLSWTLAPGAINTMVRAAPGRMPANQTDGYLVYYGSGTYVSDFRDIATSLPIYYRAWSQRADGAWETLGTTGEGNFMSMSFIYVGLIIMGIALSIMAFVFRKAILSVLAASAWASCMVFIYQQPNISSSWGLFGLFFFCMVAMFGSLVFLRPKKEPLLPPNPYQHIQNLDEKLEFYRKMRRRT